MQQVFSKTKLFCVFLNLSFSFRCINFSTSFVVLGKMLYSFCFSNENSVKAIKNCRNFESNQFKYFISVFYVSLDYFNVFVVKLCCLFAFFTPTTLFYFNPIYSIRFEVGELPSYSFYYEFIFIRLICLQFVQFSNIVYK